MYPALLLIWEVAAPQN